MGVIGTGYGKSLLFQLLPHLVNGPSCVIVLSPMVALVEDQIRSLRRQCIPAQKLA
jgi:superfamily II DNA helicase RecQ